MNWANAIFAFADADQDYCVTRDEMEDMMAMFRAYEDDPS